MTNLPLVSIVTPSFNQGEFLEATLLSVFEQDYPLIEYLVMDGGSTDGSLEILRRNGDRLAYWESEADRGQAHAINKGLKRSTGELIGWLNSDDVLLPNTVSRVVATFQREPDFDVVYGRLDRIDSKGQPVPTPTLPKDRVGFGKENLIGECVVNQPGLFWRRRVMAAVGYLDESLQYALDYEYWTRMVLSGFHFLKLPEIVAQFRLSQDSKTVGHTAEAAVEHLRVIDRLTSQSNLPDQLGLSKQAFQKQEREGKSIIQMYAAYGFLKQKQWSDSIYWVTRAHLSNPLVLFSRRWVDLGIASLSRRFRR